ncbi:MAG TPA: hypothetical protein VFV08_05075, partial [Puia sp.]|nr:hypothetical protein [Puia sp.]
MNPSMNYPILSGEMLDKGIEEIRNRLIFLETEQAQLKSSNPVVSASQKAKPPVSPFDPLYDQLDLSWVDYKVETMPARIYCQMPRFSGHSICDGNAHIQNFHSFMGKYSFRDEDMWMRFLVRSFDAKAKDWYLSFPKKSFACWDELADCFKEEFAKEPADRVAELMRIRKQDEEPCVDFSHRFAVALSHVPESFRPDISACVGIFFEAFEEGSSALLRDFKVTSMQMAYKFIEKIEKIRNVHLLKPLSTGFGVKNSCEAANDQIIKASCADKNENESIEVETVVFKHNANNTAQLDCSPVEDASERT